jgi:hypothetical protein
MGLKLAGLDCGKQSVSACVISEQPANLKRFAQTYKPVKVDFHRETLALFSEQADIFAIEPTGIYYQHFHRILTELGKDVRLVSPRRVRQFAEYHGLRNKSDRLDPAAIAAFTWENLDRPNAFLSYAAKQLTDCLADYRSQRKRLVATQQRLDQALCLEFPEVVKAHNDSKRDWLEEKIPALWRYLAGEDCYNKATRDRQLATTAGVGLSDRTRDLALELCRGEESRYRLERELTTILKHPDFDPYNRALDIFDTPPKLRGELIAIAHPFDRFLEDGKESRDYVFGDNSKRKSGKTKRNRSMDGFKLYNGLGRVQLESGTSHQWKAGGSARMRAVWFQLVECRVVLNRPITYLQSMPEIISTADDDRPWTDRELCDRIANEQGVTWQLASAWVHYENLKKTHPVDKWRRSLVAGRCCKLLYRELLLQHS